MSETHNAEKGVCDGCQKRPCVCETVVLPNAERDTPGYCFTYEPCGNCHRCAPPAEKDAWYVWLPSRQRWVALASEAEARAFAEKFDGTTVARDIPPGRGDE